MKKLTASLSFLSTLLAFFPASVVDARPELEPPLILWEGGAVAVEGVQVLQSGYIEVERDGSLDRAPLIVEVQAFLPNDLPLHRAYQLRLSGMIESPKHLPAPIPIEAEWTVIDPREELHTLTFSWDLSELGWEAGMEAAPISLFFEIEAAAGDMEDPTPLSISEPYELDVAIRKAELIEALDPSRDNVLSVPVGSDSPAAGVEVHVPKGSFESKDPAQLTIAMAAQRPSGLGWSRVPGPMYEIEAQGVTFTQDIQLILPANDDPRVPKQISFFDPDTGFWSDVLTEESADGRLLAHTNHLSTWSIGSSSYELILELVEETTGDEPLTCRSLGDDAPCSESDDGVRVRMERFQGASLSVVNGLYKAQGRDEGTLPAVELQYYMPGNPDDYNPPPVGSSGHWLNEGICHATHSFDAPRMALASDKPMGAFNAIANTWEGCYDKPEGQEKVFHEFGNYQNDGLLSFTLEKILAPGKVELATVVVPSLDGQGFVVVGNYQIPSLPCSEQTRDDLATYLGFSLDPSPFVTLEEGISSPFLFACLTLDIQATPGDSVFDWSGSPDSPPPLALTIPGLSPADTTSPEGSAPPEGAFDGYDLQLFIEPPGSETTALSKCQGATSPDAALALGDDPGLLVQDDTLLIPTLDDATQELLFDDPGLVAFSLVSDSADPSCSVLIRNIDADGDGVDRFDPTTGEVLDCNDLNPAINPDEPDNTCDGLDNDCDKETDEGAPLAYPDSDGDSFGDAYAPTSGLTCVLEDGMALNAEDCDDTNSDINPDATETCDLADNDCDGSIDERVTTAFYPDGDGDGMAPSSAASTPACHAPAGYTSAVGDCDDFDPSIYEGAPETCEDGIDQDCDGEDNPCDEIDNDGDGYTLVDGPEGDCDDANPAINPGAPGVIVWDSHKGALIWADCSEATIPSFDLDGDGSAEALRVEGPAVSIQAFIDGIFEAKAYLAGSGENHGLEAPSAIAIEAGTYNEHLRLVDLDLTLVGLASPEAAPVRLKGQGSSCLSSNPQHRCSVITALGGRLHLENVEISNGWGTPLNTLDDGTASSAPPTPWAIRYGGALLTEGADVSLTKVSAQGNQAHYGAAIAIIPGVDGAGANSTLHGVELSENVISIFPDDALPVPTGALYVEGGVIDISASLFEENDNPNPTTVASGAAIAAIAAEVSIFNSRVLNNSGPRGPGLMVIEDADVPGPQLLNTTFARNTALYDSGAVMMIGSDEALPGDGAIIGALFDDNKARTGLGGALTLANSDTWVEHSLFSRNSAFDAGALALSAFGSHTIIHSVFDTNLATGDKGRILKALSSSSGPGHLFSQSVLIPAEAGASLPCSGITLDGSAWWSPFEAVTPQCAGSLPGLIPPEGEETPFLAHSPWAAPMSQDFTIQEGSQLYNADSIQDPSDTTLRSQPTYAEPGELGLFQGPQASRGVGALTSPCGDSEDLAHWGGLESTTYGSLNLRDPTSPLDGASPQDAILFYAEAGQGISGELTSGTQLRLDVFGPALIGDGLRLSEEAVCDPELSEHSLVSTPETGSEFVFVPQVSGYHLMILRPLDGQPGGGYRLGLSKALPD